MLRRVTWCGCAIIFLLTLGGVVRAQRRAITADSLEAGVRMMPTASPTAGMPAAISDVPRIQGELTVFAAASLTDAFREIGTIIEQANPGTKVRFNFAGSPTLRTQLAQGARADVYASADEPTMQAARRDGSLGGEPRVFAQNLLVMIVPTQSPAIATLQELAKPDLKVVLAHREVPVGNYARQSLAKMSRDAAFGGDFAERVIANVVSEEVNVKQVVTKVQLGEADAGIVYATDVTTAARGALRAIDIPTQFNVIARYPIAVVKGARHAAGAQAFIDYVLSPAGQAVLTRHGFSMAGSQ
jgi:molybdate transport system substrate-binding protein